MQFTLATLFTLATAAMAAPKEESLAARGDGAIVCGPSTVVSQTQEREHFVEGQNYLHGLGAQCGSAAGHCSRVSCSNDAAIWLCNNSGADINNMDCGILADYVDHIFDQCQKDGLYAVDFAVGYQENTDGWVVQAGWNSC